MNKEEDVWKEIVNIAKDWNSNPNELNKNLDYYLFKVGINEENKLQVLEYIKRIINRK